MRRSYSVRKMEPTAEEAEGPHPGVLIEEMIESASNAGDHDEAKAQQKDAEDAKEVP